LVKLALQLSEVLPTHQIVNAILVMTFLAMGKVFDQAVAVQQVDNLRQAVLQAFLRLFGFYFSHWRAPPQKRSTPKGINQSIRDWAIENVSELLLGKSMVGIHKPRRG